MSLPKLKIGRITARLPIVQGGMGVGVSLHSLASAVICAGGIGVIAGSAIGLIDSESPSDFVRNTEMAMRREIRLTRETAGDGPIGVNIMVALSEYELLVRTAADAGADIIFSGAGLPLNLPTLVEGTDAHIVPIVSTARAAALLCKAWATRHDRLPDAIVVEGPLAGGHLGFTMEQLLRLEDFPLEKLVTEVIEAVAPWGERQGFPIPVLAAGGIFTGADIAKFLNLGASGVQMATRFVCTEECDASMTFKQAYLDAEEEDIGLIVSPVGMPGRAIKNKFLTSVEGGWETPLYCPYQCIKTCVPENSPYCIALALDNARQGQLEEGFVFAGQNAWRCNKIVKVKDLMDELEQEAISALAAAAPA